MGAVVLGASTRVDAVEVVERATAATMPVDQRPHTHRISAGTRSVGRCRSQAGHVGVGVEMVTIHPQARG
jgi:hypothetical protein